MAQQPESFVSAPQPPPLPHVVKGICPGEGCRYGSWRTRSAVEIYDTYRSSRKAMATLRTGSRITALTGIVTTERPGRIRMIAPGPAELQAGDVVQVYTYYGEGNAEFWFRGRYYKDFDISFATYPDGSGCVGDQCFGKFIDTGKSTWWARVRLASGQEG